MIIPFSPRATLCTAAVFTAVGAVVAHSVPAGGLQARHGEQERRSGTPIGVPGSAASAAKPMRPPPLASAWPGGAFDTDCSHVGDGLGGPGYQFIATCPGRAVAPNGALAVAQTGGEAGHVRLVDRDGQLLDDLPNLMDGMPFVLFWSPRSDWFFVNHYEGSTMERLRIFQVVNRRVVERSAIVAEATRIAVGRYPCLARSAAVHTSGWRWSRDGRRILFIAYSRPDACLVERGSAGWVPAGEWEPTWMIGEAEGGRVDPRSVRPRPNGLGEPPIDGPYAGF